MRKIALFALLAVVPGAAGADEARPAAAARPAAPAADAWKNKTFTAEELKKYNGKTGPAYVAVNGIVYDVSSHASWKTGTHMGHQAGQDLTKALEKASKAMHGEKAFEKYPRVGVMAKEAPVAGKKTGPKKEEGRDGKTAAKK